MTKLTKGDFGIQLRFQIIDPATNEPMNLEDYEVKLRWKIGNQTEKVLDAVMEDAEQGWVKYDIGEGDLDKAGLLIIKPVVLKSGVRWTGTKVKELIEG